MTQTQDRILATHVGSLVRPEGLVKYLRAIEDGADYNKSAYETCLKDSIADVVRKQADAGIDVVSDGEYGKGVNWAFYIHRRMTGIRQREMTPEEEKDPMLSPLGGPDRESFADFYAEYDNVGFTRRRRMRVICDEPLKYTGYDQVRRDIDNLKAAAGAANVEGAFLPCVAPASALPNVKDEYYGTEEKFLFALAEVLREEYKAVVDAGLSVQIDDAFMTTQFERMVPPKSVKEYQRWAQMRIDALNHALEGIPTEKTRYHICWGSWNGPHMFDVPFEYLVDLVLTLNVGHYLFESANPRHEHEWRIWESRKPAPGRKLVPGVVSHATNVVEHPQLVADRLSRLARLVGRENVMAGTDCGFAQSPFLRRVHPSIQWAKLKMLSEGARLASDELWGRSRSAS
ncbi:cobalamin-independent methionine synthase II family protein [Hyphococcus luteus]|uniref:Cobalamin-independent methionine synthase MetE C-terminal/archaeal domain-containing protein n=1 Tax=Hyphococcus luteus TaxID=2058213 RepID=A0A2S7K527_9PROT|nr:cobalamin-independent methionine synthase II family protein [Marinicaulis flavus]PQA87614.1 hypothetical protein CW354_11085 [Marinicaulis flavus]